MYTSHHTDTLWNIVGFRIVKVKIICSKAGCIVQGILTTRSNFDEHIIKHLLRSTWVEKFWRKDHYLMQLWQKLWADFRRAALYVRSSHLTSFTTMHRSYHPPLLHFSIPISEHFFRWLEHLIRCTKNSAKISYIIIIITRLCMAAGGCCSRSL